MREERAVARVFDRVARVYDRLDAPERRLGGTRRRRRLLREARGEVLEVGIGTGLNLAHYPDDTSLTGIDISERMLERASRRSRRMGRAVRLELAGAQKLPFPDGSFDTVAATCVFCSVADPAQGLREVRRVLRPGGRALLLEIVRPRTPLLGRAADLATPLTRRLMGAEVNRRIEEEVTSAGLVIREVRASGIWREIVAEPA